MSPHGKEEFDHSLIVGSKAFSTLKQNSVPVWPDMYEVVYAYESSTNAQVVMSLNELKKRNEPITIGYLKKLHEDHIANNKVESVTEEVASQISDELKKIVTVMKTAGDKSEQCETALKKIESKFTSIKSAEQLHSVVSILSDITNAIANNNKNLNTQLNRSSQQINLLHKDLEQARNESNTDALTGLFNRKKFDSRLAEVFKDYEESGMTFCLLMLDIDFFKKFNDSFGHQTGDQILRLVAHTIKNGVKGRDLAARYGGEEFVVILPGTPTKNAFKVAEQIREAVAAKELIKRSSGQNLGRLTISIGISEVSPNDTPASLIESADNALYQAKETGRNRCVVSSDNSKDSITQMAG